jgi:hypothetical protein
MRDEDRPPSSESHNNVIPLLKDKLLDVDSTLGPWHNVDMDSVLLMFHRYLLPLTSELK